MDTEDTVYYVDGDGYLLDENHQYLLDEENNPIKIEGSNKASL